MGAETPVVEAVEEPIDIDSALKEVLKKALIANGLSRGLRECVKALEQGKAHLCILAADCNEPAYVSLITALCLERGVKLLKVQKAKSLVNGLVLEKLIVKGKLERLFPVLVSLSDIMEKKLNILLSF